MYQISSGWLTIIALVVFLVFMVLVLPDQASKAQTYSEGTGSPDTSFYYTAKELYQFAEEYGSEGRREYVRARFSFDVIWPLVYTFFLCTSISWVFSKFTPGGVAWRRVNLAPVIGLLLDFAENISTSVVMIRYPNPTIVLADVAAVFTLMKWIFVNGSFILLLIGVVLGLVQWVKKRRG